MNFSWTIVFRTKLFFWEVCFKLLKKAERLKMSGFLFFMFLNRCSLKTQQNKNELCITDMIDRVQCYLPIKINTAGHNFLLENLSTSNPNMYLLSEASTLQRTEPNFVLSSSRLPQYDRLAALGQKKTSQFVSILN